MSQLTARRFGWICWALTAILIAMSVGLNVALQSHPRPEPYAQTFSVKDALFLLVELGFVTVGALIASHLPRHPIAWILCGFGLGLAVTGTSWDYAAYGIFARPGLPAIRYAAWLTNWAWMTPIILFAAFLVLFPTGRPLGPRWRWVGWTIAVAFALEAISGMLSPEPNDPGNFEMIENPLGLESARGILNAASVFGDVLLVLATLAALISLFLRFRRSAGIERQQIKWLFYAATVFVALQIVLYLPTGISEEVVDAASAISSLAVAVAIGFAILRYRLYDIDRLINRTIVYGALTVVLGATYLASILFTDYLLTGASGGETPDVVVAGATLVVAALFNPARRRIQHVVDRRFYRNRYDAARTVDRFAARLRDEVDLDSLEGELRAVVRETMQPAHVSVWLRSRPERGTP